MKNIAIFRIFVAFPLIGIALPDAAAKLEDVNYHIPAFHFILFSILGALLLISFAIKAKADDQADLAN